MTMHQSGRRSSGGQVAVMLLLGLAGSVVVTGLVMAALVTYDPPVTQPGPQAAQATAPPAKAMRPAAALPVVHTPSAALVPPLPIPPQGHQATSQRAPNGYFFFDTVVNGMTVRMVFDTGATLVALRAEDAARAGIAVNSLSYDGRAKTANGTAEIASVVLDSLKVGDVTRYNVPAMVARPGALFVSLLGQSFMSKLSGYRYQGSELILQGD